VVVLLPLYPSTAVKEDYYWSGLAPPGSYVELKINGIGSLIDDIQIELGAI
jgi:hypothetical protein